MGVVRLLVGVARLGGTPVEEDLLSSIVLHDVDM